MYRMEDLEKKTVKELLHLVSELKGKLLALRFENSTGQLEDSHLIKDTKKDIARIFTVVKRKQLVEKKEEPKQSKPKKEIKTRIKYKEKKVNKSKEAKAKKSIKEADEAYDSTKDIIAAS